jgi:prophage antirepressor-like protein
MTDLQTFNSPEFGLIRTTEVDNEPWFVGKDVATALGYSDTSDALRRHVDGEDKLTRCFTVSGQSREMYIINESGLYSLILSSKLPTAKKFKRWVTAEVLPAIRKNGGYIAGQETMSPEELMAKALLMAQKTIADRDARISALQVEVAAAQPKAAYFDELVDRNLLTGIRETAKELGIKQKVFVDFLLNKKYLHRSKSGKLTPTAGRGDGLFEMKECFNDKTSWAGTQVMVTPKGRETFRLLCQGM